MKLSFLIQSQILAQSRRSGRSDEFILSSIEDFKDGKVDALYLVYNGYKNMITQELHVNKILPVDASQFECSEAEKSLLEVEAEDEEKMLDALVDICSVCNVLLID